MKRVAPLVLVSYNCCKTLLLYNNSHWGSCPGCQVISVLYLPGRPWQL